MPTKAPYPQLGKPAINDVLAENLRYFMQERGFNQSTLGKKAGLAQRTIGNYLKPSLRQAETKSGKLPSAKLTELEKVAAALGVEPWELLRPISPQERVFYRQIEDSFNKLRQMAPARANGEVAPAAPDKITQLAR
jgi:transcriptional regulator with XRE-family HTH domain